MIGGQIKKLFRFQVGKKAVFASASHFLLAEPGLLCRVLNGGRVCAVTRRSRGCADRGIQLAFLCLLELFDLGLIDSTLRWVGRHRLLSVHHSLDELGWREIFHHLSSVHAQGAKRRQTGFQSSIVNLFWMELQFNPLVYARGHHALHIPGAWTKCEAVECMHGALLLVHLRRS